MFRSQVWLSTLASSGERREGKNGVVAIALNGYFPPDSEQYRAPKILEVDPALANDKIFHGEMEKLSKAFETKLATLKAAHELAQSTLIAEAKLRNSMPLDFSSLMAKAAVRNTTDQASKKAMQDASQLSVMQGVPVFVGRKRLSSPSPLSQPKLLEAIPESIQRSKSDSDVV